MTNKLARVRCCLMILAALCVVTELTNSPIHKTSAHNSEPLPVSDVPFDLVENNFSDGSPKRDLNGLMLNPQWSGQTSKGIFPDPRDTHKCPSPDFSDDTCVHLEKNKPVVDIANLCTIFNCGLGSLFSGHSPGTRIAGHVNWRPATYMGKACFNDFSYDGDFTLNLSPLDEAGLTELNPPNQNGLSRPRALHTEFDTLETVRNFITPEWKDLAGKFGDDCQHKPKLCDINNKRAIEVGLVGLDTVHSAYSELHPVYALAIETESPGPPQSGDTTTSKWVIFARNRGDEGDCASHDHPLLCDKPTSVDEIILFLPGPKEQIVSDAFLLDGTAFASNYEGSPIPCPVIGRTHSGNDDGVFVRIPMPRNEYGPPAYGPLVEGVVRIEWHTSGQAASSDWKKFDPIPCNSSLTVTEKPPNDRTLLKGRKFLSKRGLGAVGPAKPLTPLTCGFLGNVNHQRIPEMPITAHTACDRGAVNKDQYIKELQKARIDQMLKNTAKK